MEVLVLAAREDHIGYTHLKKVNYDPVLLF